ncbi:hypothetical protein HK098_005928 [Nowakowskiella sp. JEL0407]|nr:hypothetical protein HK098_005928 [Nowakowskiella sp. JEL0407]
MNAERPVFVQWEHSAKGMMRRMCRGPCGPTGVCVRGTTCTQESVSKLFVCAPDSSITSPATTTTITPCPVFSPRLLGPGEICQNWCGNKGVCSDGLTCKLDAATLEYKCSANTITTTTTVSPVVTSPVDVPIGNQCGGNAYNGPTKCIAGAGCAYMDPTFSICLPAEYLKPIGTQCGGASYQGSTACEEGAECLKQDETFSICLPRTSPTPTSPTPTSPPTLSPCQNRPLMSASPATLQSGAVCRGPCGDLGVCIWGTYCRKDGSTEIYKCIPYLTTTTTTKTTTTTTSTAVPTCSAEWGQCGGIGYTGPKCCISGTSCQRSNDYFSQCIKAAGTGTGCASKWGQCGGIGWAGAKCCVAGTSCQRIQEYYYQCL